MAKINEGANGGYRGKLGNTVGYMWRGQWCVRALPAHHNDAKSDKQLTQRQLFAQTVAFAGRAKSILQEGLKMASKNNHLTECNYFMRINKDCFSLEDGALAVDLPSLCISEGPVAPVAFNEPELLDDTTISISFEKNPLHKVSNQGDYVYLVVYCPDLDSFAMSNPVTRRTGRLEMALYDEWTGHEIHLYGFVKDNAGRASMSQYIGCGVLEFSEEYESPDDETVVDAEETAAPASKTATKASAPSPRKGNKTNGASKKPK